MMNLLLNLNQRILALLSAVLILYTVIALIRPMDSGRNASPATAATESSEASEAEAEKEKAAELKLEDLASQEDPFALHYDLESARYIDLANLIPVQHFTEIENPPPEKLPLSI
ncbi:hypothetical protein [Leptospira yasudae]|uniref:hypothetical protein n=1 Tax=Leptospira yasudae TaxID=2202201 RepID=UPI001FEDAF1D|nr:hypothetical protein [Leptospira yasudae]